MKEKNKRGRPHREWADNTEGWGENTLQKLYHLAQDRDGCRRRSKLTLKAYAHDAHGAWWWSYPTLPCLDWSYL